MDDLLFCVLQMHVQVCPEGQVECQHCGEEVTRQMVRQTFFSLFAGGLDGWWVGAV